MDLTKVQIYNRIREHSEKKICQNVKLPLGRECAKRCR